MSGATSDPENMKVWSVNDILANYSTLGVPHFQRGSVWSDENIAALLESLYHSTPCGSIVLWPNKQKENGIPLQRNGDFTHLIIDGQQRIRSLHSVFGRKTAGDPSLVEEGEDGQDGNDSGNDADGDTTIPYVWAINLYAAFPKDQKELLKQKNQPRYRNLFAKIQDPETKKAISKGYPYQYDFFPLKHIKENDFHICFADEEPKKDAENKPCIFVDIRTPKTNEDRETIRTKIKEAVMEIQKRLDTLKSRPAFSVCCLSKNDKLEDVIHTFIRINSGGRPVQSEEKAFSRLVQLCPCRQDHGGRLDGTADYIKKIFNTIQEIEGRQSDASEDREDLQRLQERQFGFRLFIRVFILALNYHTGKAIGTTGLSFSVIQDEARRLADTAEKEREEKNRALWKISGRAVIAVRRLLMDQLHLDTLAFLPDSRSLLPVFMLLIKHPDFMTGEGKDCEIKKDYKNHFAYILLTILLAATGENEGEIMKLTSLLREVPLTGEKTLRLLTTDDGDILNSRPGRVQDPPAADRCKILKVKWDKIAADAAEIGKENGRLHYANSLTNRYVLLLYALERHQKVCDFYGPSLPKWENCPPKWRENETSRWRRYEQYDESLLISEKSCPEKQHIVPYSAFRHSEGGKGRVVNSQANNVGNITYISQDQNRETLGFRWLWLSGLDDRLKKGHIIFSKAIEMFYTIDEKPGDQRSQSEIDRSRVEKAEKDNGFALSPSDGHYENWLDARRQSIAQEFGTWCRDLKNAANGTKSGEIIPHAEAIFIDETKNAADCAFLPRLWSAKLKCGNDVRQLASWLAWSAGTSIKGNTLTARPNKNEKKTVSVDLTAPGAREKLQEFFQN